MMRTLMSTAILLAGCSLVLPTSDHQGGDGGADVGLDGLAPDAPQPDASMDTNGPMPDGAVDGTGGPDVRLDAAECPMDFECRPTAPPPWEGPIVLVTGDDDDAPACPSNAPVSQFVARSGLTAAGAECECSCESPTTGPTCGPITLGRTGTSNCVTVPTNVRTFTADGQCFPVSLPNTGGWSVTASTFDPGPTPCTPQGSTTLPPIDWAQSHQGCGFGVPTACGAASACAPPLAAGQRLCVYVAGNTACPAGFDDNITVAEDVDDGRACSECSCGTVTGSCASRVNLTNGCGSAILRSSTESCRPASSIANGTHASSRIIRTIDGCTANPQSALGEATPMGVRTVCCVP